MKKLYLSILAALFIVGARALQRSLITLPLFPSGLILPTTLTDALSGKEPMVKVKTRIKPGKQVHCLWETVVLEPILWVLLLPNVLH